MRRGSLLLFAVAIAVAGCGGATKAGTEDEGKTVVLTLANHEGGKRDLAEYVAAVKHLSRGSIRLVLKEHWRAEDQDYDRGTVADVRAGKVDLAKVGAGSYDRLGVDDLQALTAPLLVDGLAIQQRVLGGALSDRMLPGVRRLGVDGLALLPGEPRRPFGLARPLLAPDDYAGGVIGIAPSRTAALTFRALGATSREYGVGELTPWVFDGAELDLSTLGRDHLAIDGSSVTANVAFWPRAFTVVANPRVLARLSREQRDVLRRAGRAALVPAIARLRAEDRVEPGVLCGRDHVTFVDASSSQISALRAAVRPVYATLERSPRTRSLIHAIEALKRHSRQETTPGCSPLPPPRPHRRTPVAARPPTPLDGTWEMAASVPQIVAAAGVTPDEAAIDAGRYRLVLRHGRVGLSHMGHWGGPPRAVFIVRGNTVELRFPDGPGVYRWNLFRDTLTLHYPPGAERGPPNPTFAPWHRVRP